MQRDWRVIFDGPLRWAVEQCPTLWLETHFENLKEKQNAQLLALQGVERCSLGGFRLRVKLSGDQTGKPCGQ